ncbi:hypothetical protein HRG_001797 [Hirsutella rhossiliensis]|uniref:Uncharacterized protein n=1 Tax=Hirsutella rhossiliensis TaxID=111463 RepID=A0A9P8N2D0_9HYPO|nr:uncharacterized protein HRG_01797 [Hirsutella rhossiliensis]KAH0966388.1 hypothetical protein HRG_01797 [Hirsutella rhossiliensis]
MVRLIAAVAVAFATISVAQSSGDDGKQGNQPVGNADQPEPPSAQGPDAERPWLDAAKESLAEVQSLLDQLIRNPPTPPQDPGNQTEPNSDKKPEPGQKPEERKPEA